MTSRYAWDPFMLNGSFSKVESEEAALEDVQQIMDQIDSYESLASELMSTQLSTMLSSLPLVNGYDDQASIVAAIASDATPSIDVAFLSKHLKIGLKTAERTLKATTYDHIRTTGLLTKRFRTDKAQLRYPQLSQIFGSFYTDYLKSNVKSVRNYIGGVVYCNKHGFKKFFPCETEQGGEVARSLRSLISFIGLPYSMHCDNHRNFKEGFFKRLLRKFGIYQTFTEPHSPWQNRAEPAIGEIKGYARKLMTETKTPIRLWCFCYEYAADVLSVLATGRFDLHGRTPYECLLHYTPDISEYVTFRWFQWCWYFDEQTRCKRLCRWLGPAHQVGQSFCSYILLNNGEFIARSTVIPIPDSDLLSDEMKKDTDNFMTSVNDKIGNHRQPIYDGDNPGHIYYHAFDDSIDDDANDLPYGDELIDWKTFETDDAYLESMDEYIGAEVVVPGRDGSQPVLAKVHRRKRDAKGDPIGVANPNPILDSRIYELQLPDGRLEEYSVNTIAENLISQLDDDGWDGGILQEIIGFRRDDTVAVPKERGFVETQSGSRPVITTKGWDLHVKWTDQSTGYVSLSLLKESNPIEVAEFAVAHKIHKEFTFNWWVHKCLRHRDSLVGKTRICRKTVKRRMKFGLEVPMNVEEAKILDGENGNTHWQDAIEKEMKNSQMAFKLLPRGDKPPPGYKRITCHLVFDIKLDMNRYIVILQFRSYHMVYQTSEYM